MELARLKPEPISTIHPMPEYLAKGQRLAWYKDMKQVFQVPWMGVVTMAFSHYPHFFETLWDGTRELCASQPYIEACLGNRAYAEDQVKGLNPTLLCSKLAELGYAQREIADIRQMIEIFSHGNQPYLIMATLARYLLEGGEMSGVDDAPVFKGQHAPAFNVPFVLMEAHHADADTRAVYEDIKAVLGLPFVNTDYRALARWPSYWQAAWADLRPKLMAPDTDPICDELHQRCVGLVRDSLPNPGGLTSDALIKAAKQDAPLEEIIAVCRLFQWLLPGLVTNVAYLRAQLLKN
jgi:hypothetical protein